MFKHALTQDVAYNSLLVQRRQEWHQRIGQAIEEVYADRLAEQYEVLAYHFAKGEAWVKALTYFCHAAEKATQAFAMREAVALYEQALEAAGHLGDAVDAETLMAIHQAQAALYFVLSDFTRARAEGARVLALAQRVGKREREAIALAGMGMASTWGHDFAQALADASQAIAIAREVDATPVMAGGYFTTGMVHAVTGQLQAAQEGIDRAITLSRAGGDVVHQSFALTFAGQLMNWRGEYAEALPLQAEALQIAREHTLLAPLLFALFNNGLALTGTGAYDEALARFEEGLLLAEKVGNEVYHHRFLNSLGWLWIECGDMTRALELNRRGAEGARKRGDHETIANAELNLGDIFLMQGDIAMAHEYLTAIHRLVQDPSTSDWLKWRYAMHLYVSLGELALARGEWARAQAYADQCLTMATRTNGRKYEIRGKRLRGTIALAQRHWEDAEAWLRQALLLARTVGNPPQLWQTYLAMGHLFREQKQPTHAQEYYQAARDVLYRLKVTLHNPALRTSLEHSPVLQAIYELSPSSEVREATRAKQPGDR